MTIELALTGPPYQSSPSIPGSGQSAMALRVLQAVAAVAVLCRFPVTLTRAGDRSEGSPGQSYVAAVYEHRVILNPEPHVPLSRAAALKHMMSNLDVYEEQAARAAEQVGYI